MTASPILQKGVDLRLVGGLSADITIYVIAVLGVCTHFQAGSVVTVLLSQRQLWHIHSLLSIAHPFKGTPHYTAVMRRTVVSLLMHGVTPQSDLGL